jgi:hypothetical protein
MPELCSLSAAFSGPENRVGTRIEHLGLLQGQSGRWHALVHQ